MFQNFKRQSEILVFLNNLLFWPSLKQKLNVRPVAKRGWVGLGGGEGEVNDIYRREMYMKFILYPYTSAGYSAYTICM
jgi:hypothetical protein